MMINAKLTEGGVVNYPVIYKSYRYICGKAKWVFTDIDGNVIKHPTKEQKNIAVIEDFYSHRRRKLKKELTICCKCRNVILSESYSGTPQRISHMCDKQDCTRYICMKCNSMVYSKRSDSQHNAKKSVASCRTGNLDIYSPSGKGLIGESIIAKVRRLSNRNIDEDNMHMKIDLSFDYKYGDIQAKFCTPWRGGWYPNFGREHNFDTLFVLCASKNMKNIDMAYAIPEKRLFAKDKIYIVRNSITWEEFRIDENIYNDIFYSLLSFLGNRRYFGIQDINKWLYHGV